VNWLGYELFSISYWTKKTENLPAHTSAGLYDCYSKATDSYGTRVHDWENILRNSDFLWIMLLIFRSIAGLRPAKSGRISECQTQQMKPMNFQGKSIRPKKLSQLRKRRRPYARVFLKIRAKSCRRWGFVWKFFNSRREDLNSSYENSECVDAIPSCSALRVKESRKTHKTECRHFHILIGVLMQQDQPAHLIWFLSCLLYYLIYFVDIIFPPAHFTKILLKQTHTLRAQVKNEPICRGHLAI